MINLKKILTSATFAFLAVILQNAYAQEFSASAYPDRIVLTLTANPSRSQAVNWRTDQSSKDAKAQIKIEDASPEMEKGMQEFAATSKTLKL